MIKYHLPGLFEFYELYREFITLFGEHREYFYDWCEIGSIYGAPSDCMWGGGRVENDESDIEEVLNWINENRIPARLTFSNSLLEPEHLSDKKCNELCKRLEESGDNRHGVIVHSDLLLKYLMDKYPGLYMVSSTTKVITDYDVFIKELEREDFAYVVPDFRLNKEYVKLNALSQRLKDKVEFLCNECCDYACVNRNRCYESVSRKNLGVDDGYVCMAPHAKEGYSFSKAMSNPGFISVNDIINKYGPMGFTNYKIEGRGLGSALILEFLLYYMTKPEYQIHVREAIYLDNMLDLF